MSQSSIPQLARVILQYTRIPKVRKAKTIKVITVPVRCGASSRKIVMMKQATWPTNTKVNTIQPPGTKSQKMPGESMDELWVDLEGKFCVKFRQIPGVVLFLNSMRSGSRQVLASLASRPHARRLNLASLRGMPGPVALHYNPVHIYDIHRPLYPHTMHIVTWINGVERVANHPFPWLRAIASSVIHTSTLTLRRFEVRTMPRNRTDMLRAMCPYRFSKLHLLIRDPSSISPRVSRYFFVVGVGQNQLGIQLHKAMFPN